MKETTEGTGNTEGASAKGMTFFSQVLSVVLLSTRFAVGVPFCLVLLVARVMIWLGKTGEDLEEWTEDMSNELSMALKPRAWEMLRETARKLERAETRVYWLEKERKATFEAMPKAKEDGE